MNKIPTLFWRDPATFKVIDKVRDDCRWVLDGEGVATRKYNGVCVMYDSYRWWTRREVKVGKTPPDEFIRSTNDRSTGDAVGWEPIEQSGYNKYLLDALSWLPEADLNAWEPGTFELCGPQVNGNEERYETHVLNRHAFATRYPNAPREFEALKSFLNHPSFGHEGLVWHHPDGVRMAKLKGRDFR